MGLCAISSCSPKTQKQADLPKHCFGKSVGASKFIVCKYAPKESKIAFFLKDENKQIIGDFENLRELTKSKGQNLEFAMNGGMYLENRDPVGLYVENHNEIKSLFKGESTGNFGLKPNGVFYINDNQAGVLETSEYDKAFKNSKPEFATQSGPMLVINGNIHPKFIKDSKNLNIRNGVGIDKDGNIFFAISKNQVNFYDMAILFKDELKTDNALYLDGTISKIYSKELGIEETGDNMGPIIGVIN